MNKFKVTVLLNSLDLIDIVMDESEVLRLRKNFMGIAGNCRFIYEIDGGIAGIDTEAIVAFKADKIMINEDINEEVQTACDLE